jgi:hypothetical protein
MRTRLRMRMPTAFVPPEEPPPGDGVLATKTLTTGTACFHFALPQGWATNGVKVGALDTQTDIKTTWPDGSIRDCQVSCVVPSNGSYDITEGTATSGSFTPTWPTASVAFVISGTTWTATLPALTTSDPFYVGPTVKEYRVKTVPMNGATPHGALEVWFDVRSYAQGGHRIYVQVMNIKDVAANNAFTYDVTVTIAGSSVFTRSSKLEKTTTGWARAFTTGSPALSTVTYDLEPYFKSYAIQRYRTGIPNNSWPSTDTLAHARYDILAFGDMSEGMASPGGRPELGPYPSWVAEWITHQNPATYAYMIRAAEQSFSWSGHISQADGTSIKRTDFPDYWLDGADRGNSMSIPQDPENFNFLVGLGEMLEINHLPDLWSVAYMVTGDRFFLDQGRRWGHACILMEYMGDGWHTYGIGSGAMRTILYTHQVRGVAWGFRTLGRIAAFLPDGDPDKTYFQNAVAENLTYFDWVATTLDPGGPNGIPLCSLATGGATTLAVVPWQCDYVLFGMDLCNALGFSGGEAMRIQLATWRIKMLTSGPDYNPQFAFSYWIPFPTNEAGVGTQASGGNTPSAGGGTPTIPAGVSRTWLTMAQIFTGNFTGDTDSIATSVYAGEGLMGTWIAVQMGIPNALTVYNDLVLPDANAIHPGWLVLGVFGTETA